MQSSFRESVCLIRSAASGFWRAALLPDRIDCQGAARFCGGRPRFTFFAEKDYGSELIARLENFLLFLRYSSAIGSNFPMAHVYYFEQMFFYFPDPLAPACG